MIVSAEAHSFGNQPSSRVDSPGVGGFVLFWCVCVSVYVGVFEEVLF